MPEYRVSGMKKIEAVIKEEYIDAVRKALDTAGFSSMTIYPVRGRGSSGGMELEWRAGTYKVDFLHKVMLMLVVKEEWYKVAINIIVDVCKDDSTGGAGKIFVSTVDEVIRVRTGEYNTEAL
jgi:nitrogen regulatory protein P-II 1